MTEADQLLFPKPPLVFTGIIRGRNVSASRLRNLPMRTAWRNAKRWLAAIHTEKASF